MRPRRDGEAESDVEIGRLAHDLRQSASRFVRAIRETTGTARTAQSETLDLLDRLAPVNVATLAKVRGVTHQTMRLVVAHLEASGLTKREVDPADCRSRLTSLTSAGRDAFTQERKIRSAAIGDAIQSRLSPDDRDLLRAAILLLDRLAGVGS